MPLLRFVLVAGLCAASAPACAFEASFPEPGFVISVPALPPIPLTEQAASSTPTSRHFTGDDGQYSVSLAIDRTQGAITTRECAGSILRSLVARPGMPARDNIYRAPLNERTFLVIYILDGPTGPVFHSHVLASAASTHCIEAHFSRARRAGEDEDDWRKAFLRSSIVERVP